MRGNAKRWLIALLALGYAATAQADDKALALKATSLTDSEFTALKTRMKTPISTPCKVAVTGHGALQVPPKTCTCIRDAYYDGASKAAFEEFAKTKQFKLDKTMEAAQKKCLLTLPAPIIPAKSDERYNMLQALQTQCLATAQARDGNLTPAVRNICSCLATKQLAELSNAELSAVQQDKIDGALKQKISKLSAECKAKE